MKKIIIVTNKLVSGGIEKALINMLKNFKENVEITLLVRELGGELYNDVPKNIKIEAILDNFRVKDEIITLLNSGRVIKAVNLVSCLIKARFSKNSYYYHRNIIKTLPEKNEEYDLAIAYGVHYSFCNIYTIDKIISRKKVLWIHSDTSKAMNLAKYYKKYYKKYNHIFAVSNEARDIFCNSFIECKDKSTVFYNSICGNEITKLSMAKGIYTDRQKICIVTVARLSKEKGIDIAINVLDKLINDGYDLNWYCIGEGEEREKLEVLIKEKGLVEKFILSGNKSNPYPYMREADIYVQPSRSEGYCLTLAEARVLHKPIVTTDFAGAREQICNRINGLITSVDINEMYMAVKELLDNIGLREQFTKELSRNNIDTRNEIEKLNKYL